MVSWSNKIRFVVIYVSVLLRQAVIPSLLVYIYDRKSWKVSVDFIFVNVGSVLQEEDNEISDGYTRVNQIKST